MQIPVKCSIHEQQDQSQKLFLSHPIKSSFFLTKHLGEEEGLLFVLFTGLASAGPVKNSRVKVSDDWYTPFALITM